MDYEADLGTPIPFEYCPSVVVLLGLPGLTSNSQTAFSG